MSILDIHGLTKVFPGAMGRGPLVAVDDVTLTIPGDEPQILSIVGESGSGKTTMARMILRLLDATKGTAAIRGIPIDEKARGSVGAEKFKRMVQPIFQNPFEAFSARRKVEILSVRHSAQSGRSLESHGGARRDRRSAAGGWAGHWLRHR